MQDASDSSSRWDSSWLGPSIIVSAVLAIYLHGALSNGFAYDDTRFIIANKHVLNPQGLRDWLSLLFDPHTTDPNAPTGIVRPLRTFEFAVDHALFRLDPRAFHLHSLAWFMAGGVGCLGLLRRLVGGGPAPLLGTLIWIAHPMQVEAAAWISSRGDLAMSALVFFALSAVLDGRTWRAVLLGVAAMLFKETAVILPLLVFAVRLVRPVGERTGALPALRASGVYFGLSAAYLVYRSIVQVGDMAHVNTFVLGGSVAGTFATMFRAFGAYVVMLLSPVRPAVDWYLRPSTGLADAAALSWLVIHASLIVSAVRCRVKRPWIAAAICFFYFPLIPVANWPFPIGIPTTERFLHLSVTAVSLLGATAAARFPRVRPALAVAVVGLAVVSIDRVPDWRNDDTLFAAEEWHAQSPRTESFFAARERSRGLSLRRNGREAEATAALESALDHAHRGLDRWRAFESVSYSTSDVVVQPHVNASNLCVLLERWGEALWHGDRALAAGGDRYPETQYNRALALVELDRPLAALNAFDASIAGGFDLDDALAGRLNRIGESLLERGYGARADDAFERAGLLETSESRTAARAIESRWASAAASREDWRAEAVEQALFALGTPEAWTEALDVLDALTPRDSDELGRIQFLRARCFEELGRDDEALAVFRDLRPARGMRERQVRLSAEQAAYLRVAVERIETGCPAWEDHGLR